MMTPKTKKVIVIVGSLLLIASVVGYLYVKNKKDKELENAQKEEDAKKLAEESAKGKTETIAPENIVPSTANVPVVPPTNPPSKEVDRPLVKATTLLAGGLLLGNNKGLYANFDGLRILDMNNNLAFKTKKGQRLGTIYDAKQSGANIIIYFVGAGGVKLKAVAQGLNIK